MIDCPDPKDVSRWYRDGYMARLNGKPLSANPKAVWLVKGFRWREGWTAADEVLRGIENWDAEQDIIEELLGS